jgi:hypothetical protein
MEYLDVCFAGVDDGVEVSVKGEETVCLVLVRGRGGLCELDLGAGFIEKV